MEPVTVSIELRSGRREGRLVVASVVNHADGQSEFTGWMALLGLLESLIEESAQALRAR